MVKDKHLQIQIVELIPKKRSPKKYTKTHQSQMSENKRQVQGGGRGHLKGSKKEMAHMADKAKTSRSSWGLCSSALRFLTVLTVRNSRILYLAKVSVRKKGAM